MAFYGWCNHHMGHYPIEHFDTCGEPTDAERRELMRRDVLAMAERAGGSATERILDLQERHINWWRDGRYLGLSNHEYNCRAFAAELAARQGE